MKKIKCMRCGKTLLFMRCGKLEIKCPRCGIINKIDKVKSKDEHKQE